MNPEWEIVFANKRAQKEILDLTPNFKAKILNIADMFSEFGVRNVGMPYVKPLSNGLWEMRLIDSNNIARSIYITKNKGRILILHTFIKKTQKTPDSAIKLALKRLKEYENENENNI